MFELTPYSTRRNIMDPFNFFNDFFGTSSNSPMELRTDITDKGDSFGGRPARLQEGRHQDRP